MLTNEDAEKFLTRVEQLVKSEVKILLTSQRSIELRQAKFEMLLKQWIDAGSHGRFHRKSEQRNTTIEERTGSLQPAHSLSLHEKASCADHSPPALANDAQVANPGQDQRELSGHNLPRPCQPIDQDGSDLVQNTSGIVYQTSEFLQQAYQLRESELGQQLRDKLRQDGVQSPLDRIVFSWVFDVVFGMLIFLNSLSIGAEIEHKTTHANPATWFTILATTFAILFLVELVLRIAANGLIIYFHGPDKLWNIFDVAMVIVSMIEVLETLLSPQGRRTPSWRLLRMVRLLRIARVLRFVPQLRILLIMIFESVKSLAWLLCILLTILYIFSIIFTMAAIDYLGVADDPSFSRKRYTVEIATHYGTLMRSIYTLFKAITSGQSWGEMMDPLTDVGAFFVVVFLFYIAFAVLALLNIMSGELVTEAHIEESMSDSEEYEDANEDDEDDSLSFQSETDENETEEAVYERIVGLGLAEVLAGVLEGSGGLPSRAHPEQRNAILKYLKLERENWSKASSACGTPTQYNMASDASSVADSQAYENEYFDGSWTRKTWKSRKKRGNRGQRR